MYTAPLRFEIAELPPYVRSWSVVSIPNFILSAMSRWQRNFGNLPLQFTLVACPQTEIAALGGLPSRVVELTDPRVRIKHFTSCNKLYLIILLLGEDAEERRDEIQKYLPWSESYHVDLNDEMLRLRFIEAVEDCELLN
jgi:hypothetical protein